MNAFQVGKNYATRTIGHQNCVVTVTVVKRTPKKITSSSGKTFRVWQYQGVERVKPLGSYSMALIVSAYQIE